MIVTLVHVWVKPEFREAFLEESMKNHLESVKEPANLRFDLLQDADDENKFVFYEAYESEQAVASHKETNHYLTWRNAVEHMMSKTRQGIKHKVISPKDKIQW